VRKLWIALANTCGFSLYRISIKFPHYFVFLIN
jgi:hypothetical protein